MGDGAVVVVGGTGGTGREVARHYHDLGRTVVITGRDQQRTAEIAREVGEGTIPVAFDLAEPESIADALADIGPVSRLVLAAIARDNNPVPRIDRIRARRPSRPSMASTTSDIVAYKTEQSW